MDGLPCMNCKKPVPPNDPHFFSSVFLCGECANRAYRFYERSEQELKQLLLLLKEKIRTDLIESKFFIGDQRNFETASKADVFRAIGELEDMRSSSTK